MVKTTNLQPWELAAKEGKTIIGRLFGPMIGVYYPYRKTGDMYVLGPATHGQTFHCCQECDKDFPIDKFIEHINFHNKRFKRFPNIIMDGSLIAPDVEADILNSWWTVI